MGFSLASLLIVLFLLPGAMFVRARQNVHDDYTEEAPYTLFQEISTALIASLFFHLVFWTAASLVTGIHARLSGEGGSLLEPLFKLPDFLARLLATLENDAGFAVGGPSGFNLESGVWLVSLTILMSWMASWSGYHKGVFALNRHHQIYYRDICFYFERILMRLIFPSENYTSENRKDENSIIKTPLDIIIQPVSLFFSIPIYISYYMGYIIHVSKIGRWRPYHETIETLHKERVNSKNSNLQQYLYNHASVLTNIFPFGTDSEHNNGFYTYSGRVRDFHIKADGNFSYITLGQPYRTKVEVASGASSIPKGYSEYIYPGKPIGREWKNNTSLTIPGNGILQIVFFYVESYIGTDMDYRNEEVCNILQRVIDDQKIEPTYEDHYFNILSIAIYYIIFCKLKDEERLRAEDVNNELKNEIEKSENEIEKKVIKIKSGITKDKLDPNSKIDALVEFLNDIKNNSKKEEIEYTKKDVKSAMKLMYNPKND